MHFRGIYMRCFLFFVFFFGVKGNSFKWLSFLSAFVSNAPVNTYTWNLFFHFIYFFNIIQFIIDIVRRVKCVFVSFPPNHHVHWLGLSAIVPMNESANCCLINMATDVYVHILSKYTVKCYCNHSLCLYPL